MNLESSIHNSVRLVFMGTPEFAAAILRQVANWKKGKIVGVWCQPDRPAGRGYKLQAPAVKKIAEECQFPIFQPHSFKDAADIQTLADIKPDFLIVAAYGLLLPQSVLDIPRIMPLNVHASLLPRFRGAAPIQRVIMSGDTITGITIMRLEKRLDAGAIFAQRAMGIGINDTAESLSNDLADLGGRLLIETLDEFVANTANTPIIQNERLATYAAKLTKTDGLIHWDQPVSRLHAQLRGVTPWPGGRSFFHRTGKEPLPVIISPGTIGSALDSSTKPGTLLGVIDKALAVASSNAVYLIHELKPANSHFMDAAAFWNGYCRNYAKRSCFAEE